MHHNTPNHHHPINPAAMYRARDCAHLFGIGRSTWWEWSRSGKIQRGIRLGARTTVWQGSYLLELQKKLISESQN